jgi:adenylate cyclase
MEHGVLACRAALQCRRFLESFNIESVRRGAPVFRTRMGINSGEMIVGNMGYEQRLNYTVMGDNVNLASRLEGLNKYYGTQIIISEHTYALAKDGIEARIIDVVAVKGKQKGVAIYELVSEKGNIESELKSFIDLFNEGMSCYLGMKWSEAITAFQEIYRRNPMDRPSQMLLERCRNFVVNPPPGDWSGVIELLEK